MTQAPSARIAPAISDAGDWRLKRWNAAWKVRGPWDVGSLEVRVDVRCLARRLGGFMAVGMTWNII